MRDQLINWQKHYGVFEQPQSYKQQLSIQQIDKMEDTAQVHVIPDNDNNDNCKNDDNDNQQQTILVDGSTDAWGLELLEQFYIAGQCMCETGAVVICGKAYHLQMKLQSIKEQQNQRQLDELDDENYNSGFHKQCCLNTNENGTRCTK